MNAEKIIKKVKIAIVNKYYVSFDDVELIEYKKRYTFTHDLAFYIKKLNKYVFVDVSEVSKQIGNTEEFEDELHTFAFEFNGLEELQGKTYELLNKVCEKCICDSECEEPCELIRELKRYLW